MGIAGGSFLLMPRTGTLKVYVAGPQGQDVGPVDVYVDDRKVCSSSPCLVRDLEPGIHDVYAESVGYAPTATKGVEIEAGSASKFEMDLAADDGTIKVAGAHPGIELHVDGKKAGSLPQNLEGLSAGTHELRFAGSDRYEPLTKTVTVKAGKVEDLGEIELKVIKGHATFEVATEDTRMRLVPSEGEPREIDADEIEDGEIELDIDASKEWTLEACSVGHEMLDMPIAFPDGKAERTFEVELEQDGSMTRDRLASWCRSEPKKPAVDGKSAAVGKPAVGTPGKVSFNSIPPSAAVLLDGRPVGRTPMGGVSVPPGTHSVVFIHPKKGRKATSVTVKAGQNTGVGVRF